VDFAEAALWMNTGLLEALYVCVVDALHQYEENMRTIARRYL